MSDRRHSLCRAACTLSDGKKTGQNRYDGFSFSVVFVMPWRHGEQLYELSSLAHGYYQSLGAYWSHVYLHSWSLVPSGLPSTTTTALCCGHNSSTLLQQLSICCDFYSNTAKVLPIIHYLIDQTGTKYLVQVYKISISPLFAIIPRAWYNMIRRNTWQPYN